MQYATEYMIALSSIDRKFTKKELSGLKERFLYKKNGDQTVLIKAEGNSELRGKVSIPPLPQKFKLDAEEPADESFRNWLEESKVIVQVTPKALKAILMDGRMKNAFNDKTIDGISGSKTSYKEQRKDLENRKFGLNANTDPSERPIYGYVESPHYLMSAADANQVNKYGRHRNCFKK